MRYALLLTRIIPLLCAPVLTVTLTSLAIANGWIDGLTRSDVPRQTVHVVKIPGMKILVEKNTVLNVSASMEQLPDTLFFRASDIRLHEGFYKLGPGWNFEKIDRSALPERAKSFPWNNSSSTLTARVSREKPCKITIKDGDRMVAQFPSPLAENSVNPISEFYFFNSGRSVCFYGGPFETLYVINDVSKPKLVTYNNMVSYLGVFGDPSVDYFFAIEDGRNGDYYLNRFDPLKGSVKKHFVLLSNRHERYYPFGKPVVDSKTKRIFIATRYGGPSMLIDSDTGKVMSTVSLSDEDSLKHVRFLPTPGPRLALVSNKLVDLSAGKIVATLPGLHQISATKLSKDGRFLIYATDDGRTTLQLLKLIAYDLVDRKISGTTTLKSFAKSGEMPPVVQSMWFTPDGNLVVLSGDQAMYDFIPR